MSADSRRLEIFRHVIESALEREDDGWLFLPKDGEWTLETAAIVIDLEEVPPEEEDEPEAGYPDFVKQNNFKEALDMASVAGIVFNARAQKPDVSVEELFDAFMFYYERDAFMEF